MSHEVLLPSARRAPLRASWRRLLPAALSLGCVGLLLALFWGRLPTVWRLMQDADYVPLALALAAYLAAIYLQGVRLALVLGACGIRETAWRCTLYTLIGLFFGNFLPTAVGGDLLKASYAAGRTERLAQAFAATFIDRGLGMLGIVVIGSTGLALHTGLQYDGATPWLAPLLVVGFVVVALLCQARGWGERAVDAIARLPLARRLCAPEIALAYVQLMRAPGVLLATFGLTLVAQAVASLCLWATAWALHLHLGYPLFLVVLPAMTVASMLPSLNGMGVREAALVLLLAGLVPEEQALALGLVFYGMMLLVSGLGGLVYVLRRPLGLRINPRLVARFAGEP
ncbi:MAG TPA: lysylphosphatidylglycerol synthase transmembrane domain-containing protein [Chloroflexota bacterium]